MNNIREDRAWEQLLVHRPQLTLLVIGGNDIMADTDMARLALDMEELTREIEKTGGYCYIAGLEKGTEPPGINLRSIQPITQ